MKLAMMTMISSVVLVGVLAAAGPVDDAEITPAQRKIRWARAALETNAVNVRAWNSLALAFAQRARETAETDWYAKANEAIDKSLTIAPGNYGARRVRAWVLLGQHDFVRALELATELNRIAPDDLMVYGMLVDANVELGNYAAAETAAQWMLDMRPGHIPGLTRAAHLRELFGDPEGALELFDMARSILAENETEDRAWILTHMARIHRMNGRHEKAVSLLDRALGIFARYHYALAELAWTRLEQGDAAGAVESFRQRFEEAPHPENRYDVARALIAAGRPDEAAVEMQAFVKGALAETDSVDNANRELAFYYAEEGKDAERALAITRKEMESRKDVMTLHAHAWALHGVGRFAEAERAVAAALEVGVREPVILYHAAVIASSNGDAKLARSRLQASLGLSGSSVVSQRARELMRELEPVSPAPSSD